MKTNYNYFDKYSHLKSFIYKHAFDSVDNEVIDSTDSKEVKTPNKLDPNEQLDGLKQSIKPDEQLEGLKQRIESEYKETAELKSELEAKNGLKDAVIILDPFKKNVINIYNKQGVKIGDILIVNENGKLNYSSTLFRFEEKEQALFNGKHTDKTDVLHFLKASLDECKSSDKYNRVVEQGIKLSKLMQGLVGELPKGYATRKGKVGLDIVGPKNKVVAHIDVTKSAIVRHDGFGFFITGGHPWGGRMAGDIDFLKTHIVSAINISTKKTKKKSPNSL